MARGKELKILEVAGGGEIVATRTPTGQFSSVERRRNKNPIVPARLQGDLRNVAAYVASRLQESDPTRFSGVETCLLYTSDAADE